MPQQMMLSDFRLPIIIFGYTILTPECGLDMLFNEIIWIIDIHR